MYFIGLGLYTPGTEVRGSIMAVVTPAGKLSAPALLKEQLEPAPPGVRLAPKRAADDAAPGLLKGEGTSASGIVKLSGRPLKRKSARYGLHP
jgi:hypothetical protein